MTNQITCQTCKFWNQNTDNKTMFEFGYCKKVVMFWDGTDWEEKNGDYSRNRTNPEQKFFVQDGSDYSATLITTPDFGCNQAEQK